MILAKGGDEMMQILSRLIGRLTAPAKQSHEEKEIPGSSRRKSSGPAEKADRKMPDARQRFYEDVKRYADRTGPEVPFAGMRSYWPVYENMSRAQADWYFYWRTQVRQGVFPETDEAYILLNCYEILCGCGWQEAQDGYDHMKCLLEHYREAWPRLDFVLTDWLFDFSLMNGLRFDLTFDRGEYDIKSPVMVDVLTAIALDTAQQEGTPVRLQFPVIDALTDYKMEESRFYRDGHALLMRHAVPRVIALIDALSIKNGGQRFLEPFSHTNPVTRRRDIYMGALCPKAGSPVTVSVVPYSQYPALRSRLDSLVRLTENELRRLTGYRGRLRGSMPDEATAALVRHFLEREYGVKPEKQPETVAAVDSEISGTKLPETEAATIPEEQKVPAIVLDFDKVRILREQSDAVREALRTDAEESAGEIEETAPGNEEKEGSQTIENTTEGSLFCPDRLDGGLRTLMESLSPGQQHAVAICLEGQDVTGQLERLADEMMTMPALILDEINQAALEVIGDILLEETEAAPEVMEEYREPLKHAMMYGA